jgi:phage gp36-like protein
MSYSTQSDLAKLLSPAQLIQLTDDNADGAADADPITEAIAQADAEIDGYLGARYPVPVSPVPDLLRTLSVAIATWKLYSRRSLLNDMRRTGYVDAIDTLKRLAAGTMVLPASGGGEVATDGSDLPAVSESTEDRLFTRGRTSTGTTGTLDQF